MLLGLLVANDEADSETEGEPGPPLGRELKRARGGVVFAVTVAASLFAAAAAVPQPADHLVPPKPQVSNAAPAFPAKARAGGFEGSVAFRAQVTEDGAVAGVEILSTPAPGVGFEEAVRDAVSTWRFDPARRGGRPVAGAYESQIRFKVDLPRHSARMFARPSSQVWSAVKELMGELRLKPERKDERAQVLLTRSVSPPSSWRLPDLELGPRIVPRVVSFQVFVSPYAEPARVHVATELGATDPLDRQFGLRLYDVAPLQSWLFDRLEEKLGEKGRPIPDQSERRAAVARDLLGERPADACLGARFTSGAQLTEPKAIDGFKKEPIYPGPAAKDLVRGVVNVEATLLEDGALVPREVGGATDPKTFLATSAVQAVRFWVYEPARANGCPIEIKYSVSVRFRMN
jgi:protein TonB